MYNRVCLRLLLYLAFSITGLIKDSGTIITRITSIWKTSNVLLETRLREFNRIAVDDGGGGDCFFSCCVTSIVWKSKQPLSCAESWHSVFNA